MAINTVNDIPAEIKEIAEAYYKGNSSVAFDKAKQLKQARKDLADPVDIMLGILKDPPLSLFTFYDAFIERASAADIIKDVTGFSFDDLDSSGGFGDLDSDNDDSGFNKPISLELEPLDIFSENSKSLDIQPIAELSGSDVQPVDTPSKSIPFLELSDSDIQPIDDLSDNDVQPIADLHDSDIQPIVDLSDNDVQPIADLHDSDIQPIMDLSDSGIQPVDDPPPAKLSDNEEASPFDKLFDDNFDVDQALDISFASFNSKISENDPQPDKHLLDHDPMDDSLSGCNRNRKEPINLTDSNIDINIDVDESFDNLGTSRGPGSSFGPGNSFNQYSGLIRRNIDSSQENQNASRMGTPNQPLAALYAVASESSPEDDPFSSFINAPSFGTNDSNDKKSQTPVPNTPRRQRRPSTLSLRPSKSPEPSPAADFFGRNSSPSNPSISLNPSVSDHSSPNNLFNNRNTGASAFPTTESTPIPEPSHNPFVFKFDDLDDSKASPKASVHDSTPAPSAPNMFSFKTENASSAADDNSFPFNFNNPSDEELAEASNPSNPFSFKLDGDTPSPTSLKQQSPLNLSFNETPVPTAPKKSINFAFDATPAPSASPKQPQGRISLDATPAPDAATKNPSINFALESTPAPNHAAPKQPGRLFFDDVTPAPSKSASNPPFAASEKVERKNPFAASSASNERVSRASFSNPFAATEERSSNVERKNPFSASSTTNKGIDKLDSERRSSLFSRTAVEKDEASFMGFGHRIHNSTRASMREELVSKPQQTTMNRMQAIKNENLRPTSVGLQAVATPGSFANMSKVSADTTLAPQKVQRTKTPTLETDELAKLHPLTRTPRLCISMAELAKRSGVDARAGFILSLIDGTVTINDILSISSWSQTETASILCSLKSQNIIDFD